MVEGWNDEMDAHEAVNVLYRPNAGCRSSQGEGRCTIPICRWGQCSCRGLLARAGVVGLDLDSFLLPKCPKGRQATRGRMRVDQKQ